MKKLFLLLFLLITWVVALQSINTIHLKKKKIAAGENLEYSAEWGLFTIGSASINIDKQLFRLGKNICYKISANATTNGIAGIFYLNDKWSAYIDTATITTHRSYRSIREGRYEKDEIVYFNHTERKAQVSVYNKNLKKYTLRKTYDTSSEIRDYIAGFMLVRFIDFNRYQKGDIISISGFYEEKGYKIDVVYSGKEFLNQNNKKILCYKILPQMPQKSAFVGKQPVEIWITADISQKLIRARGRTFFGNIVLKLKE
jgi:hypothetical protein